VSEWASARAGVENDPEGGGSVYHQGTATVTASKRRKASRTEALTKMFSPLRSRKVLEELATGYCFRYMNYTSSDNAHVTATLSYTLLSLRKFEIMTS
jgi:hypothetical protein